MGLTFERRLLT